MPAQKKQLSLDTNLLFDLAGENDFAHDFREVFQNKGYALVLPPTAVHELSVNADLWPVRPVHPKRLLRVLH